MPDPVRVFVSYHHSPEEDAFTAQLVADLKAAGADTWVDVEGITSDSFVRKISEGLAGRQWLILVMTPASVQSPWVQREVEAALNEVTAKRMLGVIPFVMEKTAEQDIPILWRTLHRYDATQGYDPARDRLFQTLRLPTILPLAPQPSPGSGHFTDIHVPAYRNTFPAYSRKDEPIVRAYETVVEASGDRFLRDVRMLRADEEWQPRLLQLIDQADVFQLFWSRHAAESKWVEKEWRYALTLLPERPNFIRPVYWTPEPYPIPPELRPIAFGRLQLETLGIARPSLLSRIMRREG